MAEKETKKSGGKFKKFIIFLVVIALLAGGVVGLVVLLRGNDKSVAENLNDVSSVTMVDNEEVKADYATLKTKIQSTAAVSYYNDEAASLAKLVGTVDEVADYYNQYYIFAQNNKIHKSNKKKIKKALKNIKNVQKEMNELLDRAESSSLTTNASTHLQNMWIDYREMYAQQFENYKILFASLNKVYHGSLGKTVAVNQASKNILNAVDDYMTVLNNEIHGLVKSDTKGNKSTGYNYTFAAKIDGFDKFVQKYIANDETITEYYFIETPKIYHDSIANFYSFLDESNFINVINTIQFDSTEVVADFDKAEITDDDMEADNVCYRVNNFIVGGDIV